MCYRFLQKRHYCLLYTHEAADFAGARALFALVCQWTLAAFLGNAHALARWRLKRAPGLTGKRYRSLRRAGARSFEE